MQLLYRVSACFGESGLLSKWSMPIAAVLLPVIATEDPAYSDIRHYACEGAGYAVGAVACYA